MEYPSELAISCNRTKIDKPSPKDPHEASTTTQPRKSNGWKNSELQKT